MSKADEYRTKLRALKNWDAYLLEESGLPGPRGNIELAQVVADEGDFSLFHRYVTYTADQAPVNNPREFLAFCGVVGLGRLLAKGDASMLTPLRVHATDPRWRVREGVAMALQRLGDVDMANLVTAMRGWSTGTFLEQRAAAAALCEPRLLRQPEHAEAVLEILDEITRSVEQSRERRSESFQPLRKGLGYCWSVAVAALPARGKALMEKWLVSTDKDIQWIMKENLRKTRLARMDSAWVREWQAKTSR